LFLYEDDAGELSCAVSTSHSLISSLTEHQFLSALQASAAPAASISSIYLFIINVPVCRCHVFKLPTYAVLSLTACTNQTFYQNKTIVRNIHLTDTISTLPFFITQCFVGCVGNLYAKTVLACAPNFFWGAPLAQTPANFGPKRRFLVS